jgi:hypothetical protein
MVIQLHNLFLLGLLLCAVSNSDFRSKLFPQLAVNLQALLGLGYPMGDSRIAALDPGHKRYAFESAACTAFTSRFHQMLEASVVYVYVFRLAHGNKLI